MTRRRGVGLSMFVAALLLRCGASEVGNPEEISLNVVGIESPAMARLSPRGGISATPTITAARIVLGEIRFKTFDACASGGDGGEIRYAGPYVVDLRSDESIPPLEEATLSAGTYCEVELTIKKLEEGALPAGIDPSDPIVGSSLRAEGVSPEGTPFVAKLEIDEEFKIKNETTGFPVGLNGATDFFIVFRLYEWFEGVDLSAAEVTEGTILIDKDHNEDALERLKANVQLSSELFEDQDKDGLLEEDESDDDDLLGEGSD